MCLSAVLLTLNEEKNIKNYIKSIRGLVKELIIVDGGSKDKTLQLADHLCKKYGIRLKKIVSHSKNFSKLRMLGEKQASSNYVLCIDADEMITRPLRSEIKELLKKNTLINYNLFVAYGKTKIVISLNRMNFVTELSYPSFIKRVKKFPSKVIIKKKSIGWFGIVHEKPKVWDKIYILKNEIFGKSYIDKRKIRKYIKLEISQSKSFFWTFFQPFKWIPKTIIRSFLLLNWRKYFLGSLIFTFISFCYQLSLPIFYCFEKL